MAGSTVSRFARARSLHADDGFGEQSEEEIAAATLDLARIGVYVEPTSGQAAAAFRKLLNTGTIEPEQTTVLVLTGSGLKATPRIAELLGISL